MKGENPIRVRLIELLADGKEPTLLEVPRGTLYYHMKYLARSGLINEDFELTPKGMLHYLRLLKDGVALPPSSIGRRVGIWLNRAWAHFMTIATLLILYALLDGRAMVVFHVVSGPPLTSIISLSIYIGITSALSALLAKGPLLPASYVGLLPVTISAFLPLEGMYRLVYCIAQTASILLCSDALHRATRIGMWRALALNLAVYGLGLILCW